jgi:hypothetical protein
VPGRQRRIRRQGRTLRGPRPEWRPARLVHRRIPLTSRIHPQVRRRNDSVIAAIAEVIRDAIAAESDAERGSRGPKALGHRMESDTQNEI